MNSELIETKTPFKDLFSINENIKNAIKESMLSIGYDQSQPIIVWSNNKKTIVIDGHTRLLIAKEIGIKDIPIFEKSFNNELEALQYALHNQRDRRNLTDADLLRAIAVVDKIRERGGDHKSEDFKNQNSESQVLISESAQETANIVGAGKDKVYQARRVLGDEGEKEAVLSGEKTIHRASEDIKKKKEETETKSTFNRTNENIEWASWTWNPITGCKHGCDYCYARNIANHYFKEKFEPTFHPERLQAPQNTPLPKEIRTIGDKTVFCVSMGDMFGDWVPQEWIDQTLESIRNSPQWNFLILTKNPKRLIKIDFPRNVGIGTTVDTQKRVKEAEHYFKLIKPSIKFVSCEPLLEEITFNDLSLFDWLIIGGQRIQGQIRLKLPEWKWIESLLWQGRQVNLQIYFKPNTEGARPKEYPKWN